MKYSEESLQETKAIKKGKKIKKEESKKGLMSRNCSDFGGNGSLDGMRHVDFDKMIQAMLGDQNSQQKEKNEVSRRKRNFLPQQSRFSKEYPLAIIGQMIKAIALLQGQHYRRLQDALSQKDMLAKTKFVFLCVVIVRYPCLSSLPSILREKLKKKEVRMEKKYKDHPLRLQQGKQCMQKFSDIMNEINRLLQMNPDRLVVQDSMNFIFSLKQSRPGFEYTQNGLKKMHNKRQKQPYQLRNYIQTFDRMMRSQMEELYARHQFIRPNIGGVPLQEAHYESLEDTSRLFLLEDQQDFS